MKPYRRGCTVPLTLLTSVLDKSEWLASHPSCFMPRGTAPVSTEEETGWAPEHFQKEKCPVPDRLQSPHHSDCSRVTTLTTPPWLQTYSDMISKTQSKNNTWCRILSWWRTVWNPVTRNPPPPTFWLPTNLQTFPPALNLPQKLQVATSVDSLTETFCIFDIWCPLITFNNPQTLPKCYLCHFCY